MSEAKLYYVSETGLVEGEALGRLRVYLSADYDALKEERDQLREENARLQRVSLFEEKRTAHYMEFWRQSIDEPFQEWIKDPFTHWVCSEDAAYQAWQYLHENKIWVMKEQTENALAERDQLRAELAESRKNFAELQAELLASCTAWSDEITRSSKLEAELAAIRASEPVAWVSEAVEEGQRVEGRPRRLWWENNKGV